jgi:predicted dehydrogenase
MTEPVTPAAAPLPIALIGAGAMAEQHLRAFLDVPGVRVVGLHSRTPERASALAARYAPDAVIAPSVAALAATGARLVVVAASVTAMYGVARACLAYPWAILLEKPPALNLDEAEKLAAEAEQAGARVAVGLNRRTYGATLAAAAALHDDPNARYIAIHDQQDRAAAAKKHDPAAVTYWMYANSIHLVDYAHLFARGRVLDVQHVQPWDAAAPCVVVAHLTFSSGDRVLYEAVWEAPGPWAVHVTTPVQRWELRPLETATVQQAGSREKTTLSPTAADTQFKPGFRVQAERAAAFARGSAGTAGLASLADAVATMRLIHRIYGV